MLVIGMNQDETTNLYNQQGESIGKVSVMNVRGDKIRIGFEFSKDIIIARPGISFEQALIISSAKETTKTA